MVTYSDDYDVLDIHMVSGMDMICIDCSPMFLCRKYADRSRAGASDGLLWPSANAAAGLFIGGQMT